MKRPAIFFSLCYIAGVLTKLYVNQYMAMIGIIAIIILICFKMKVKYWRYLLALSCLCMLGYINMARVEHTLNIFDQLDFEQTTELVGRVVRHNPSEDKLICQLTSVTQNDIHQLTRIKVLISNIKRKDINVGDCIRVKGSIKEFLKPTNPGGFNAHNYYYSQGIFYTLYSRDIEVIDKRQIDINRFFHNIRTKIERQLYEIFPRTEASILSTMLLGVKGLSQDTKELYQLAGISHLLAISGLHITIIGMGFFHILNKIIRSSKVTVCLTIVIIISYSILTGCSASTIRATIMLVLMLLTICFKENYDAVSALFIAALGILLFNPYQILDIGFMLSFSAVGGILWLTPLLNLRFNEKNNLILQSLFVSLGATLTTLPIITWYFYCVPLYALIINLLVIPATSLIIGFSIISLIISFVSKTISITIGGTVYFALRYIEGCCRIVNQLPLHSIAIGRLNPFEIAMYYALLYLFFAEHIKQYWIKIKFVCGIISICYIAIIAVIPYYQMKIAFLDVGQGDGAVIEYRDKVFLIDGGGQIKTSKNTNDKNTGTYVMMPYLASQGINHIDGIFISHSDFDHIYGIIEVIKEMKTDFIVLSEPYKNSNDSLVEMLLENAAAKGIKVFYLSEGYEYTYKDLNINCLYPSGKDGFNTNNNGNSMVLRIDFKAFNALFTGDIEADQEKSIIEKDQTIVELIKVPHHGSDTSSTDVFLEIFSPNIAVFSYGKNNFYGHPSTSVVERYNNHNIVDYHISETGAVIVKTNGSKYSVQTYLSNRKDKYICSN